MSQFRPRQGQWQILEYQEGLMGVSAVPGSGKTTTIAALAARLISRGLPGEGQVLIVTYQNAAVDHLRARVREELEVLRLRPLGYEVRTLHSLSYGIVHAHPGLAGAAPDFHVLDERDRNSLLDKAVRLWNSQNSRIWGRLAPGEYYDERWEQEWQRIARQLARAVIAAAKNRRLGPGALLAQIREGGRGDGDVFLRIGAEIYQLYQQQVETTGGLDFDDLVWLAVDLLEASPDVGARLHQRWPVVLEDEAQDSVPLQEELLARLTGKGGNWVRVGDPNQAIMSTFTSADPRYLRRFLERPEVQVVEMSISGRCVPRILDLANYLVEWTCQRHPLPEVRQLAFRRQQIRPAAPDDPHPNPPDETGSVVFREYPGRSEELEDVARRAWQFAASRPECTLAVLVPTNRMGYEMAGCLKARGAAFDELLQSSQEARQVSQVLHRILAFLADPLSRPHLEGAYRALREAWPAGEGAGEAGNVALLLRSCYRPEALLFPEPGRRLEEALPPVGPIPAADAEAIRVLVWHLRRWLRAASLPVDQVVMSVAQDLMAETDLARAQKLAVYLRVRAEQNPGWRLPELAREMGQVARGPQAALVEEEGPFTPRPGRITLTTMHRAKGLEWDLVYLVGVDGNWFPHTLEDHFLGEYDFLGGDPAEEARAGLATLVGEGPAAVRSATEAAHLEVIAERLRLLYVGITRARQYLSLSWGRDIAAPGRVRQAPAAAAFRLLEGYYQSRYPDDR